MEAKRIDEGDGRGDGDVNRVLVGGGQMGALMRALDWSRTAVGDVQSWPQSLRTAVSILLESKFPMMIAWGPQFTHFYNDAYRPILGSSKHPSLGKPVPEVFPEIWSTIGPLFAGVMQGNAVGFDDLMVPLDRYGYLEECYFTFSYSPIRNERGEVGGVHVTVAETTNRVVHERRLRTLSELAARAAEAETEAQAWRGAAEALAANPADIPFVLLHAFDRTGQRARLVASAGPVDPALVPASAATPGSREPELVTDVATRLGMVGGGIWPEPVTRALALPVVRPGAAGAFGTLLMGLSPRRALDDGYRDFCQLVANHVAAAVANSRAHEEERSRAQALSEVDRAKDEFLAMLGHELRNPLSPILTSLHLMRMRGQDSPERDVIERQVANLTRLVDDLLDVSRITRGKIELRKRRLELAEVVVRGLEIARPLLAQRRQQVRCDVPTEGLPLEGDPDRLAQVVSNLITNAGKYSEPGSTVHLAAERTGMFLRLRVRDEGVGINAEMLERIFDLFVQEPQSLDRSKGGLGLGLAIVRSLVELHGGTVSAASEGPGRGSEFVVHLPLALGREAEGDAAPPPETPDPPADRNRILVVDDNVDGAQALAELLQELGHEVALAHDGPTALKIAKSFRPDVCLLDIGLPVMDGYEVARQLRQSQDLASGARIVAISGYGQDADRLRSTQAGFDAHLVKPVTLDALTRSIFDGPPSLPS